MFALYLSNLLISNISVVTKHDKIFSIFRPNKVVTNDPIIPSKSTLT